jgi:hypothetical protein
MNHKTRRHALSPPQTRYDLAIRKMRRREWLTLTDEDLKALEQHDPWLARTAASAIERERRTAPMTNDEFFEFRRQQIMFGPNRIY